MAVVEQERRGNVALLTLNRPEARNAISPEVSETMVGLLDDIEADPAVRAVVLTGAGEVFSAGADLKVVASGRANDIARFKGGFAGIVTRDFPKPLIAAVNGPALAGGCEIVLSCDLVVASTAARFGLPEVKRSLVAAAGGLFRLPRVLPRPIALEVILTGDPIDAERAYHFGLVNQLCEPGGAFDAAVALAERINANAPLAVREARYIALAAVDQPDEVGWKMSFEGMAKLASTEDFAEGPRAFIEKRAPEWKGR